MEQNQHLSRFLQEQMANLKTSQKDSKDSCNLKQYEAILKNSFISFASQKINRDFEVDNDNRASINAIFSCFVLKDDQSIGLDVLKRKISTKKGFFIFGDLGCGKSTFMSLLSEFKKTNNDSTYKFLTAAEICQHYKQTGSIDKFTFNEDGVQGKPATYCIDELGREPKIVDNYGTKLDVLSQVLQDRYVLWQSKGVITHLITNLDFEELGNRYGEFIKERIVEMCNVIEFKGQSKRF